MKNRNHAKRNFWLLVGTVLLLNIGFIPFSAAFLGAEYQYTLRIVTVGGALLGTVSGVIGSFAVLRQQSLMGDALSHAALPGVAIAFLVIGRDLAGLLIGAAIAGWLGVNFISAVVRTTRIKQDTAMGIVLAGWFGIGVALLSYIQKRPNAGQAGLDQFIFGQAAAIVQRDVILIAGVGLAAFLVLVAFWKEFKLITFDYEFAAANGFRVRLLDVMLSTLIVVAIVLGLQLAGVILMVGLLIAPAVAARQWTNQLEEMVILAGLFGAFAGSTGAIMSALDTNLPTGPLIIVMAFAVVTVSLGFAPERGLLWTWWQQRQDRRRFAARNILQDIYRYAQSHQDDRSLIDEEFLTGLRGNIVTLGLKNLSRDGLIEAVEGKWRLTSNGIKQAAHDVRNRHLWELYREYGEELDLPIVKADAQTDIEQALPSDAVRRLEHIQEGAV